MLSQTVKCEAWSRSEARSYGEPGCPRVDQATVQLLAALVWARRARAFSSEISQTVNQYSSPSGRDGIENIRKLSVSETEVVQAWRVPAAGHVTNYSVQSPVL